MKINLFNDIKYQFVITHIQGFQYVLFYKLITILLLQILRKFIINNKINYYFNNLLNRQNKIVFFKTILK